MRLYENQVPSQLDSPAYLGSFAVDILRAATIAHSWEPAQLRVRCIEQDAPLSSLMQQVSGISQNLFPVVDSSGHLVGEFSIEDVRRALLSGPDVASLTARDLMHPTVGPLVLEDDLYTAARLLAERSTDSLVVVRDGEKPEVLGLFTKRDLIIAYGRRIQQLHEQVRD